MKGHDVGDVFEDLQIIDFQIVIILGLFAVCLLQLGQVFEDVSFELDAVEARDGR